MFNRHPAHECWYIYIFLRSYVKTKFVSGDCRWVPRLIFVLYTDSCSQSLLKWDWSRLLRQQWKPQQLWCQNLGSAFICIEIYSTNTEEIQSFGTATIASCHLVSTLIHLKNKSTEDSYVLMLVAQTWSIQLASVPWSLRVTKFTLCLCPSGVCHDLCHCNPRRNISHHVCVCTHTLTPILLHLV